MLLVSSSPAAPGGTGMPSGTWAASGASTPTHGRNIATGRTTAETAAIICPWDKRAVPITLLRRPYFFPPREERLGLDERDRVDLEERGLLEPDRDLDEVVREPPALLRVV